MNSIKMIFHLNTIQLSICLMEKMHKLFREITLLTTNIEVNYPELYRFLGENPLTIPADDQPDINIEVMQNYLESLKELLSHHLETHKVS